MKTVEFACYRTKNGHWWVINRMTGRTVYESDDQARARDFCADLNEFFSDQRVAPTTDCIYCYGLGYVADPEKVHPSIRCDCAAGRAA